MNIVIPENVGGGDVMLLPEGVARAMLDKIILGTSSTGNPKATFRYILTEEMSEKIPDGSPTMGAVVLDTVSLQPQALFTLAGIYKQATKENLSTIQGNYSEEEFGALLNERLCGTEWNLILKQEVNRDGEPRTVIKKQTFVK
ncbi:MAG: hypothetical protein WC097_01655 [Eubacteriales bacterium]